MNGHIVTFEVYDKGKLVELVSRAVRQHTGWQSVRYRGKRYVLQGGIRTNLNIKLDRPLPYPGVSRAAVELAPK